MAYDVMSRAVAPTHSEPATDDAEEFDARIKAMSGYLSVHLDAPCDFPSVVPSNCLDLRDLQTHLAERKARRNLG